MNRISLYEAIRRKKESQGLNTTTPKQAPVSDSSQRTEPRVQLKQPLAQEKPPVQVKQAVKSPIMRPLSHKSSLLRKPKKDIWQQAGWILGYVKKNRTTAWVVASGLVVVVVLLGLIQMLSGPRSASDEPAEPDVPVKKASQEPVKTVETKTPEPKPVVIQQEEKAAPVKQVEVPKPEPKAQLPAAIQSQLQKQAETVQQPPKPAGTGDHIIVIAAYTKQDDLNPPAAYFRQNGIETEIIKQGSYFLLVTKERFGYPEQSGMMIQKIKRIGANYKAPNGYERFSSTPFQDAYGKKVK